MSGRIEPGATVFLDRDGTINVPAPEGDYITGPEQVSLLPGAAEAIRALNELPAKVVVVTNQRGIALGLMDEDDFARVGERLSELLAEQGARLDAVYHCPHAKDACDCRKPGTEMLERAAREVEGVALAGGAMVGDSAIDIEAGRRLGLTTVRLGEPEPDDAPADHTATDLLTAVRWLSGLS